MSPEPLTLMSQLEAVLFASDTSLPLERIAEVLEVGPEDVRAALSALSQALDAPGRGVSLVEVGGGFRLVTRPEVAPVLVRLQRLRLRTRLSRAALETLAIIAYRQPISRPEIEQLRGVGAESVVTHLLERRLVRVVGRKTAPGRPLLYGTTREFLEHFGLRDLTDLPAFDAAPFDASAMATGLTARSAPSPGADGAPGGLAGSAIEEGAPAAGRAEEPGSEQSASR